MNEFICFSLDYHANDYTLYANSFHLLTRAIDSGNMNRMATRNSFSRAMCEFHCTLFHMISAWAISWSEIETNSLIYLYLCLVFFCCLHFSFSLSLTLCFMARPNPLSLLYCIVLALCFAFYLFDLFFISHTCSQSVLSLFLTPGSFRLWLRSSAICPLYYYYAVSFLTILFYSLATYEYIAAAVSRLTRHAAECHFAHARTQHWRDWSWAGFENLRFFTVSLPIFNSGLLLLMIDNNMTMVYVWT